ncbi:hypothetical protein AB0M36_00660 [Actinoplanes sp. NPDC051346]|uniref:hypothetical protein n=1 Tax=Actinoplanes sp. NPDC051346 TaxID=3155048 RepID=UPI0034231B95
MGGPGHFGPGAAQGQFGLDPTQGHAATSPFTGSPTAGIPAASIPTAGSPTAGSPTAGSPTAGSPIAGNPIEERPAPDRFGFEANPGYGSGPRIVPTPKPPRSRFVIPALAGLVTGLLIFGTGGWYLGRTTAPAAKPTAPVTAGPTPSPSTQGIYEQNQVAVNQPKFAGPLGTVAQGWLPHLSGCSRSGEDKGPALNKGEKARVRCEMDAMSVIFVEYATTADRDKARVATLGQNVDARTLTPGVGAVVERATPSGRTNGNYVEYAYKVSGRTVSGIWWDDSSTPVAAYLLAFWKDGVGEKWEPMRDVWARYA